MKWLGVLVVVLMLLLSAPVSAQSVKLANLVGTWARVPRDSTDKAAKATTDTLILWSDSAFRWRYNGMWYKREHWRYLKGDTLSFQGGPGYTVMLKTDSLLLTLVVDRGHVELYKRVDMPLPKP